MRNRVMASFSASRHDKWLNLAFTVLIIGTSSFLTGVSSFAVAATTPGSALNKPWTRSSEPFSTNIQQHNVLLHSYALRFRGGSSAPLQSTASAIAVAVDAFWKTNPLVAAAIVCATKASLADIVAQKRQQRKDLEPGEKNEKKVDFRRTVSFMVYGALYQGMVQELIYNNFYSYLFGTSTALRVAIKKVLFDAFFHNALICIPMAYAVKAMVFRYSLAEGLRQYWDDVLHHGLLLKYYALWMPVNACIFTIIPTHYRITVMAVVSFFWMIILSTISSREREEKPSEEPATTEPIPPEYLNTGKQGIA